MNREHNTSGDGLGEGVEGGIAFFWHSSEECKIPALYSVQAAWHSDAWSRRACVL